MITLYKIILFLYKNLEKNNSIKGLPLNILNFYQYFND